MTSTMRSFEHGPPQHLHTTAAETRHDVAQARHKHITTPHCTTQHGTTTQHNTTSSTNFQYRLLITGRFFTATIYCGSVLMAGAFTRSIDKRVLRAKMHMRDLHVPNGQVIPTPMRLGAEMCSSVRHVLDEQVRPAPMRPGAKMCLSLNFV